LFAFSFGFGCYVEVALPHPRFTPHPTHHHHCVFCTRFTRLHTRFVWLGCTFTTHGFTFTGSHYAPVTGLGSHTHTGSGYHCHYYTPGFPAHTPHIHTFGLVCYTHTPHTFGLRLRFRFTTLHTFWFGCAVYHTHHHTHTHFTHGSHGLVTVYTVPILQVWFTQFPTRLHGLVYTVLHNGQHTVWFGSFYTFTATHTHTHLHVTHCTPTFGWFAHTLHTVPHTHTGSHTLHTFGLVAHTHVYLRSGLHHGWTVGLHVPTRFWFPHTTLVHTVYTLHVHAHGLVYPHPHGFPFTLPRCHGWVGLRFARFTVVTVTPRLVGSQVTFTFGCLHVWFGYVTLPTRSRLQFSLHVLRLVTVCWFKFRLGYVTHTHTFVTYTVGLVWLGCHVGLVYTRTRFALHTRLHTHTHTVWFYSPHTHVYHTVYTRVLRLHTHTWLQFTFWFTPHTVGYTYTGYYLPSRLHTRLPHTHTFVWFTHFVGSVGWLLHTFTGWFTHTFGLHTTGFYVGLTFYTHTFTRLVYGWVCSLGLVYTQFCSHGSHTFHCTHTHTRTTRCHTFCHTTTLHGLVPLVYGWLHTPFGWFTAFVAHVHTFCTLDFGFTVTHTTTVLGLVWLLRFWFGLV